MARRKASSTLPTTTVTATYQREHQQRVDTAARQDAIIDLKEVDGRSKEQQIVAATVCEHEAKRACAGPQGRIQRGLGVGTIWSRMGGISIVVTRQGFLRLGLLT